MKKRLIFLLPLLLLACRTLFPDKIIEPTPSPTPVATSALEATAFAPSPDFTLLRIYPKNGTLQNQLATEAKKASALGQVPFVEFDATWCPPCNNITSILADRNPFLMDAYRGVYLIHLDTDEWGWGNPEAGFVLDGIPAFFALTPAGKPTGTTINGGDWGEDIPEVIGPALKKFFHP